MILPEPQPPIEQILKSDSFKQRIYVRNAMYAAERVLPSHLAKLVISDFESAISLTDLFGAPPLVLRAAANVLEMAAARTESER